MRQQQRLRAGTRSRKRSLATGVAATHYDHIKTVGENHLSELTAMFHVKHGLERECVFYRAAIGLVALGCWKLLASGTFFVELEYAPVVRSCLISVVHASALTLERPRFARALHVAMDRRALDRQRVINR
jgi:hypothetical protein